MRAIEQPATMNVTSTQDFLLLCLCNHSDAEKAGRRGTSTNNKLAGASRVLLFLHRSAPSFYYRLVQVLEWISHTHIHLHELANAPLNKPCRDASLSR